MTASGCPLPITPRRMPRPLVGRLSPTELRAAALDGELVAVGDDFAPIDLPVTATRRAESLALVITNPRVIVSDRTAAWVWGWLPRPGRLVTSVSIGSRIPSGERRRLAAREVVIDPDETVTLGGCTVTTPVRTLVDLARHDTGDDIIDLLTSGILEHGIRAETIEAALSRRPRLSFVRGARARLDEARRAAFQPLLTR